MPTYKLPRAHLSGSALSTLLKCPRKYEFRYIDQKKEPPRAALIQGSAAHRVFQDYFREVLAGGRRLTPAQTGELAALSLDDVLAEREAELTRPELDAIRDKLPGLAADYVTHVAASIEPLAVEEEVRYQSRCGVTILGYLDLRHRVGQGDEAIVDYKVSGKRWNLPQLTNSIQFNLYSLMTGIGDISIHNIIPGAVKPATGQARAGVVDVAPTLRILHHRFTGVMADHLETLIEKAARLISAGIFVPSDPGSWWCSADWCGYWALCRGKTQPHTFDMAI